MPGIYQYDVEIKSNVAKLLSDMKQVQDRLDTVEGKEYKIKLNVDEKKLSSVISNLEKMLDSIGKGTGDFKQFENLSKELSNVVSEVQSLSKAFGKVDDSGTKTLLSSIQNIDKSLSELSQNILNVNKNMGNMGGNTSDAVKQIENIGNAAADAVKQVDKLADAQSKTNVANGLDSSISKYQEIVSLVKEYYELTSKIKQPTLKRQSRSEDYDRIDGYLLKKAPQKVGTTDIEKDINDRYHKMAKGVNEGSEFAIKAMRSAIQRYWSDVTEMPSDEKLLSSRKVVPYGNKGQKEEYIIPKKYQDLEKSVIQETIAMNQNNAAYEEEQKQIKANNAAIEERLNLIRQSIKQNDKNSDYNGEYKMGLSLKASDRNKKDIFGMTSNLSQEEMLKEICNMLGVEIPQNAEKAKQAVKEVSSTASNPTKDAFHSDIDTSSSVKSLENLEEEIKKIFTDANELQNILDSLHNGKYFHLSWTTDGIDETGADGRVRQLSKLLEEYGYTINNFKSDSDAFDTSGVINAIKEENNVLEQNTQKVKENTQAKEQNANANLNKYDKRLDSYNGKIDKYQATIDRFNDGGWTSDTYLKNVQAVRDAVKQYATLLDNIKTNQNGIATDEDIQNLDEYEKKIKDTIATVTNMSASEKGYSRLAGQKEIDKINKILRENSAMSSEAKAKIKAYKQELISGNPSVSLEKIHGEILKIVNAEELAGRTGRSFFDTLKNSGFHQLAAQMAGMFGFYDVINVIKQAASTVTELNTQITELAKVSEQSSKQIYADFDSYADIAKEVRGTISDTIAATADWSKNGYSIPDAKQLAEISQLYKNVGDGIDIDAANESLISTLKGFQLEADQAEHIVDVFNEVSNNEAISSGGIGEALQRSAASFNAASTSLEKSVSLVTATNSVLQNPEKVGNMWRTVSARLRGSETELKEMGADTDGLVTSTSKLQALVKGITGFDIMKDKDTYKDIYDIVLGIGEKWQDLSDIDRASLLEALASKQQSNALAAALSNIDILKKSYEEATNAEGSAREENEEYSKSIQASVDLAKAKLEQLANDILNSNFLKGAIDAGGKLINVLDSIVKSGNAIPAVATAIAAAFSFKNVGIDTLVAY